MKASAIFLLSLNMYASALIADSESMSDIDSNSEIADLKKRVASLEKAPSTLPPLPHAKNGVGIFLTGEALLWKASEEGLDYAITGSFDLQSDPGTFYQLNLKNGKSHEPGFHWDWGFRVGVGYDTHHDGWDIYSTWTRYHHGAKGSLTVQGDPNANDFAATGGSGNYISPFWVAQIFSPPGMMNRAKAHWHLNLDLADLELGRNYLITKYLSLRPSIGLRAGWIDQKYNLFFLAYNFPTDPTATVRDISVRMKNDFWGIGAKAGLNTQWFLGKGFSICGNGSFSLLDGHYHIRYKLHDQKPVLVVTQKSAGLNAQTTTIDPAYNDSFKNKKHIHTIAPIVNLALGLRWERSFCNEHCFFSIWGSYEENVFFGQNQLMNFQNDFILVNIVTTNDPQGSGGGHTPNYFTDRGNLTLRGFTGGIAFAF